MWGWQKCRILYLFEQSRISCDPREVFPAVEDVREDVISRGPHVSCSLSAAHLTLIHWFKPTRSEIKTRQTSRGINEMLTVTSADSAVTRWRHCRHWAGQTSKLELNTFLVVNTNHHVTSRALSSLTYPRISRKNQWANHFKKLNSGPSLFNNCGNLRLARGSKWVVMT